MSGSVGVEDVYSAIEEAAGLLNVACSRDDVLPVLTAYEGALAEAVIVTSMANGEHGEELDYTVTVPVGDGPDPYAVALSNGFVTATDHPVGALLSDIRERFPVGGYAIDCGVVGGFKKTYTFFPLDDLPGLSKISDIPAMPRGLGEIAGSLARHGLHENITMIGIDYQHNTANVYFGKLAAECLEPKTIAAMLRDLGLPEPSEQILEFAQKSFAIYVTVNWESSKVERITYAVITSDQNALPARMDPEIARFAKNAPHAYDGDRILVYGITVAPGGEYCKLGSYWQMAEQTRKLLMAFNAIKD
jgi:hypothetical protein